MNAEINRRCPEVATKKTHMFGRPQKKRDLLGWLLFGGRGWAVREGENKK